MRERIETFDVLDSYLVRSVVPARGKPYEHRWGLLVITVVATLICIR